MTIMIGSPILRNRAWVLPRYLEAIFDLKYPKEDIHLAFFLNGEPQDRTQCILEIFQSRYENEYKSIDIWNLNDNYVYVRDGNRDYSHFAAIRNIWLQMRKENDTHVFSVDSDILVYPETLNRLLEVNQPIVSALICNSVEKRACPQYNIHRFSKHHDGIVPMIPEDVEGPIAKIDFTGACYLIKKEVLDDNVCYGFHSQGEDVIFCKKAEEKGYSRYCILDENLRHLMAID